ncbi:MarR family winged helix-turn-helix transcriptional regulator [Paludisphaera mucosa]|uniref:MarR family winged helix-turn-helix transcriptional regulator n=1 Tax=Paludisphaera mucosa TaxID=3030827 RepID=A0ABT6FEZ0_9BACT|nr:MarR family winged helix-turn-helix transcriptional regulator [Paludisphaera mucosa]MDG3006136.1 MarR family winged helix-turn-helix transcriptional regulator [Paludisphaera mucosa]
MSDEIVQQLAAECLAGRVRTLNRVVSGIFDAKLRPYGIRSSQINILTVVAARGPLAPSMVCRRLRLEKSTLSRDLERLVEHGWIRSTPGSGRSLSLEATAVGRALLHKVKPAWDEAQAEIEKLLGGAFIQELHRVIDEGRLEETETR